MCSSVKNCEVHFIAQSDEKWYCCSYCKKGVSVEQHVGGICIEGGTMGHDQHFSTTYDRHQISLCRLFSKTVK